MESEVSAALARPTAVMFSLDPETASKLQTAATRSVPAHPVHFFADIELLGDDPAAAERAMRWAYDREMEMGEKSDIPGTANRLADSPTRSTAKSATKRPRNGSRSEAGEGFARSWPRGEFALAETLAREMVAMTEPGQNLNARGTALMRLAEVLSMAGRSSEAVPALNDAIQLYERKGNLVSAQEAACATRKVEYRDVGPAYGRKAVLTAYPVDFGGRGWTNRPPIMSRLNSKTTLVDCGGRSSLCMAFRRSGVVRNRRGQHLRLLS